MVNKYLPFRGLIFDMDGVITNTVEYHFRAWKQVADEEGIPFSRQDNARLLGLSRRASLEGILQNRPVDEATAQDMMERKNQYYLRYLADLTPANRMPGVTEIIAEAKAAGLKIGLGSASNHAHAVLHKLQMSDVFDVIGDATSVTRSKPEPDIFIWVAGAMGIAPHQALVFEDAAAGVAAAKAGGFRVIGLGDAVGEAADLRLPSLENCALSEIAALLSSPDNR